VVGDETFDTAIYTTEVANDDWRRHQEGPDVVFERARFPDEPKGKCIEFLRKLNLRFGCFDFIENDDGITFLECNPNGQYGWLEQELELPISRAITAELIKIAAAV
jgi:glutathione synthase/RimK-type ligase-like ATP-grasp enzyme